MIDNNIVKNAVDKKFTEFSDSIKTELQNKLSSHEVSQAYSQEFDRIQAAKSAYSEINNKEE